MTKLLKRYSNQKIKRFLFFLAIASLFWVLTKFSREFTSSMQAGIEYQNLPETAILAKENPDKLQFDLTANGFEILFYKFKKPTIIIPVEEFYNEDDGFFIFPKNLILQQLETHFNKYLEVRNVTPDPLKVVLDPVILKKVKVVAQTDLKFRKGFKGIEEFVLTPDSVVISGPRQSVESIDSVFTNVYQRKDIHQDISEKIGLQQPSSEIAGINPNEVTIQWKVSEFSQERFTLPVEVINLPPGLELKLVPAHVQVTFNTSVEDFTHIGMENFKIICDYAKRNQEQNFMIPELSKQPPGAVNISLDPRKIDYFIFKN